MAARLDEGGETKGGWQVQGLTEGEMKDVGGGKDGSKLFNNSLKTGICIRNSVAPLSS